MKGLVHPGTLSTIMISQAVKNKGNIQQIHFVRYVTFSPAWSNRLFYQQIDSSRKQGSWQPTGKIS